ncbi:GHKL domain-containing protein [Pedobacter sp. HMF7647]|uniref:histidine kinase n=2 Tax=Hufsiella arboris TaxID=2695275 RepID=A0A7K1Y6A0_9SPHI|nr:GHKL domain-containing protein [Hufsiella arboris]
MSFALLGVMAMQYYFIRESYGLKSQLFDQSVSEALNAVSKKVEKKDQMGFLKNQVAKKKRVMMNGIPDHVERGPHIHMRSVAERLKLRNQKIDRDFRRRDSLLQARYNNIVRIDDDFYETYFKSAEDRNKVRIAGQQHQMVDNSGHFYIQGNVELYVDQADEKKLVKSKGDSVHYLVADSQLGLQVIGLPRINKKLYDDIQASEEKELKKVTQLIDSVKTVKQSASVFEDLAHEYQRDTIPLKKRLDIHFVDNSLKSELQNRGINLPYGYKVSMADPDSVLFIKAAEKQGDIATANSYSTKLFPRELKETGVLTVYFPTRATLLVQNMKAVLLSSAALLFILATCFGYTISIILRQKKISEMKTDFINNMTHEFKTPVATIMIASEALKDPEVIEEKSRIKRLAGIIYDENVRLGQHIERVLNIAKIDRDDLKLESRPVDVNDLITTVVDSMELQLQKRNSKINLMLDAKEPIINGDELHLSNVIFNLIDNANKYSQEDPEITIQTANQGNSLVIRIADKGIGMTRDQLSKIFDQFYRVPTGNLHDVKGFGLGLSYVHNIVKRLEGTVKVKSEKDKGSEFEIVFQSA